MGFSSEFLTMSKEDVPAFSARKKAEGWRFVQILAVNTDAGVDVIYSFMKDGILENTKVEGVMKEDTIPSITDNFLAAFVFENEIHDLFGVHIENIAIDFAGNFYALSVAEPMTIISPEQKAAREKAAKIAAAKAAKEAKEQGGAGATTSADIDAEKAAKREAALKLAAERKAARDAAKAAEAQAASAQEGGDE